MKKTLLIAGVALLTFASCKKDYTCECTTTLNNVVVSTNSTTIKDTKKDAEAACTAKNVAGSSGAFSSSVNCVIK